MHILYLIFLLFVILQSSAVTAMQPQAEKAHQCNNCPSSFSNKEKLKRHKRTHKKKQVTSIRTILDNKLLKHRPSLLSIDFNSDWLREGSKNQITKVWALIVFGFSPRCVVYWSGSHFQSQSQSLDYSKGRIRTRSLCLIFLHILTFEILKIQCEQSPEKVYTCSRCSRIFTSKRAKKNHVLKKVRNLFRLTLPLQFLSLKRTEALNTTCWVKTK